MIQSFAISENKYGKTCNTALNRPRCIKMNMTEVVPPGIVGNKSFYQGTRGRVGGTVFRILNGVTIASRRPRSPRMQSPKQKEWRRCFRLATEFAKVELADPVKRAFYQQLFEQNPKRFRNARTAAVSYFLNNQPTTNLKPAECEPVLPVESVALNNESPTPVVDKTAGQNNKVVRVVLWVNVSNGGVGPVMRQSILIVAGIPTDREVP